MAMKTQKTTDMESNMELSFPHSAGIVLQPLTRGLRRNDHHAPQPSLNLRLSTQHENKAIAAHCCRCTCNNIWSWPTTRSVAPLGTGASATARQISPSTSTWPSG